MVPNGSVVTREDPYQSVHKYNRSTENATLTLLHSAYTHLEKTGLFAFSSSAFLLPSTRYNHTSWQANFWNSTLTQDWSSGWSTFLSIILRQFITKLHSCLPAPFLLALHMALFPIPCSFIHRHWHNTNHKIQFCNKNPSNSDSVYFAEVERFSNWFKDNSLDLNVKKTKEMLTDFRKAPTVISYLFSYGMKVERVNTNI